MCLTILWRCKKIIPLTHHVAQSPSGEAFTPGVPRSIYAKFNADWTKTVGARGIHFDRETYRQTDRPSYFKYIDARILNKKPLGRFEMIHIPQYDIKCNLSSLSHCFSDFNSYVLASFLINWLCSTQHTKDSHNCAFGINIAYHYKFIITLIFHFFESQN